LIEAGEDHGRDRQTSVPALHPLASEYRPISWDFFVDHYENDTQARRDSKMNYLTPEGDYYTGLWPQEDFEKLGIWYPRTAALGGCTQHNAQAVVYPQESDFDNIAALTGDDSWQNANMRKYFERLEKCNYLQADLGGGHGFNGWLQTTLTPLILIAEDLKLASVVVGYATAMGKGLLGGLLSTVTGLSSILALDVNNDAPNRDHTEEIYQIPMSVKFDDFSRSSPRDFLYEVATAKSSDGTKKYKLDIALNTLATKVKFDTAGAKPKATGIDYLVGKSLYRADPRASKTGDGGTSGTVFAKNEVIVSGGTFNTPQLLKLSGVGPAAELQNFDIPVIMDLPGVGGNMQDRYEISMVGSAPTEFSLLKQCTFLNGDDPCYDNWADPQKTGGAKGGYTTGGIALGALGHSSVAENDDPDLFKGGVPTFFAGYYPGYAEYATTHLKSWAWYTLKAHSRNNAGTVNLTSASPLDMPKIVFHSLLEGNGGEEDLQALYEGVQYSLKSMNAVIPLDGSFTRVWPPTNVSSEADLKQFIQDEAWGHHASCSCPIGADDDPMAVLDSDFRVRGIDGLRVVDASIFPKIPGEFICLAIYMVSEKAADVIIGAAQQL
jgi:choline dehydrogenase